MTESRKKDNVADVIEIDDTPVKKAASIFHNKLYFRTDITDKSINDLIQLSENFIQKSFFKNSAYPDYTLHLESTGGSVIAANRFIDYLEYRVIPNIPNCSVFIDSYVASAGAMLALAFPIRRMTSRATLMFHQISWGTGWNESNQLIASVDWLKATQERDIKLVAERTKQSYDLIHQFIIDSVYFNAKDALKYGFITDIVTPSSIITGTHT